MRKRLMDMMIMVLILGFCAFAWIYTLNYVR